MQVGLLTVPYVKLTFVKEGSYVHYVRQEDLRPLCTCPCMGPAQRRKAGDTLCRCPCHAKGPKFSEALCGLVPTKRWSIPAKAPKSPVCQTCHAHACTLQLRPPAPPPYVEPPEACGASCTWHRQLRCSMPKGHMGLHVGMMGKGKMSW